MKPINNDTITTDHIEYSKGLKYQLRKTYCCQVSVFPEKEVKTDWIDLNTTGKLTIRKGYAWDGPSGPTIDTPSFMRGSVVHDALYQLMRMQLLSAKWRKQADIELHDDCLEDGMWCFRASYVYRGVRAGAVFAIEPKNIKKVYKTFNHRGRK